MDKLEDIRRRIDSIDKQIASLFEQRMEQSRKVYEYKKANGLSVTDSSREGEVIRKGCSLIQDEQIREYYVNFQKNVIKLSKDYQSLLMDGMKVAYGGVPGAFAHIAAMRLFPNAEYVAFDDFAHAYKSCEEGQCDACVLPFENSFAGEVSAVTDLMFSGSLYVNQVIEVGVDHCLLGIEGADMDTIARVYSHPQALAQCENFIKAKGYKSIAFTNTAEAAKMVAESGDTTKGAIASQEAADLYGLKVLQAHINESRANTTRFAAFTRTFNPGKVSSGKMDRRFILMFTVKNEAGALANTLNIIGSHNFNMTNLHSRPMKTLMWNYYFYIELEGDITTEDGQDMLRELSTICDRLKIVGSFAARQ